MEAIDLLVMGSGVVLIACLLWFFFGPKQGKAAVLRAGVQEATIRVEGAYQPNRIALKAGAPAFAAAVRSGRSPWRRCRPATWWWCGRGRRCRSTA